MTATASAPPPVPSLGEEVANSVSHGVGLVLALAASAWLIVAAAPRGAAALVGASVFATSMVLVYLTSTLYHALPIGRAKRVLRTLDHAAIFLLIAGTYTPFTLGVLAGGWGWTLFGLVWSLALVGVTLQAIGSQRWRRVEVALYLGMGWSVLLAIRPLWQNMEAWGLFWLVAGGVAYTAGVAFYAAKRLRFGHFVWHLCVMAGTACHVVAVMHFAA